MEKNYPIKIVQGNYFAIALPLSKIVWSNGSKMEQPLVPNKGDLITVNLVSSSRRYDMRKIYVEDNVVHYECNEYLDLGTYSIELRLIQVDGKKYRSYQRNKIQIVATNEEADIKDGNEFGVDTYEISSAVILYAKGDKGDQGDRGPTGPRGPVGPAGSRGFRGEDGQDGLSAYQIAVEQGFVGTEEEWLLSLKGDKGEDGTTDYNELENTPTFKTINGETIIGEGDIVIEGGEGGGGDMSNYYTKTESDARYLPINTPIPSASDITPLMDGVGNSGSASGFARADHRHPSDTTKQDVINDLADIRSGASKGTTAYQKPSTGIPKTDLESNVQTSLGKADNAIQKSSSSTGLLKPNGDVDNSTYLTQHQDISGKTNTSDLSNVAFSGDYNDLNNKPTIPAVPTNVSAFNNDAGYITSADIAGKEDKVAIITPELDNNAFDATVGNYYKVTGNASAIDITLVTPSDTSHLSSCIFLIDNSNGVGVSFHTQNLPFYQAANFAIEQGKVYEVNALFNGTAWYLTQVEMEVQS